MSSYEMLNNIAHKDLRIITRKSEKYGDNVGGSLVFPTEFAEVQREYPIFFQKDPHTGEFQSVAIFGFKPDDNLFLNEQGWQANYIPAVMEREPFLIGFQQDKLTDVKTPVIHVDMENARVGKDGEGEMVFLEHGGSSPYIEHISKVLMLIHEGFPVSRDMFAAFLALDLIEPFVLEIEFDDGVRFKSSSYYTINQEKFFALDDEAIAKLHRSGYLHFGYQVISSLGNIKNLIKKYHQRMLKA